MKEGHDDLPGCLARTRVTNHDIIVLGASAGGVDAFVRLVRALPADFPAAVFIVQHVPASVPSLLPDILAQAGALPVTVPETGTPIEMGRIYVAPPDHHVLLAPGHLHVLRGPKENGFRPAIDATLRTAAQAYGPRVIGVVLTGMLDDGTAGLLAVKRGGGLTVVQDPRDAAYPAMPQSALRYVQVDEVCPLDAIADVLVRLVHTPIPQEETPMRDLSADSAARDRPDLADPPQLPNTPFVCPDCGGVLMEYYDGDLLRFRCQVGHEYSPESMVERQSGTLDHAIWEAYRALNERATLARRLVRNAQALGDITGERRFAQLAQQVEQQKARLHELMLQEP